jgi:hypothetical protein
LPRIPAALAWCCLSVLFLCPDSLAAQPAIQYRVLATSKTSTMEKELNAAADAGYRFAAVMGGNTSFGGSEVVVVMQRLEGSHQYQYRLLATSKTSTMQRELQAAADEGFQYVGQTVFDSSFGGAEVACVLERDVTQPDNEIKYEYRLLATSRTATMEKELRAAGAEGFEVLGLTVGQTAMGGSELVSITRRSGR